MSDKTFRTRLTAVSNFEFLENEKLPSMVCLKCSGKIDQFHAFMETVQSNQEQLQLSLPPIQIKNEIFLESPSYEEFDFPVKIETQPSEDAKETIALEVEMYEERENTKEDSLITEFGDTCPESFETLKPLTPATDEPEEHNVKRNSICNVCGMDFKSSGALDSHSVTHTGSSRMDRTQCKICHTWISRKYLLRKHMYDIHQAKEVTCDICHKVYANERSLATHKGRVHVNDKFECETCGKGFKRKVNLREHRAGHTGQKLYLCEFCGRKMNSNGNLYAHKKNKHPLEWALAKEKAKLSDPYKSE